MACKAEKAVVEEARRGLRNARQHFREEMRQTENYLQFATHERSQNWGNIRKANELIRWWEEALMVAENALEECQKKRRRSRGLNARGDPPPATLDYGTMPAE